MINELFQYSSSAGVQPLQRHAGSVLIPNQVTPAHADALAWPIHDWPQGSKLHGLSPEPTHH